MKFYRMVDLGGYQVIRKSSIEKWVKWCVIFRTKSCFPAPFCTGLAVISLLRRQKFAWDRATCTQLYCVQLYCDRTQSLFGNNSAKSESIGIFYRVTWVQVAW